MGYMEDKFDEILDQKERQAGQLIIVTNQARAEIERRLDSGITVSRIFYEGYPPGFIDEVVKHLVEWFKAEPCRHGELWLECQSITSRQQCIALRKVD